MKKILSIVLAIALVLGSFSFAFAATPADVAGSDYEEAVNTLMGFGIINGYPDGTYKPGNIVTRAEMAKLLIITLGYGDLAGGSSSFSDTAGHWADGYISLATGLNIVIGYPDGTFRPDATVTYDEAITMIIRGLGYTDESLPGVWPTDYKIKALELGILDDVEVAAGGANRGDVAIMLFNALNAEYGQVNADDIWEVNSLGKLLIDKLGKKVEEYQITYKNVYGAGIAHDVDEDDDYYEDGDVMADKILKSTIDLSDMMFHVVDMYMNDDDEVVYISDVYTLKTTADADEREIKEDGDIYYTIKEDGDRVGEVTIVSPLNMADLDAEDRYGVQLAFNKYPIAYAEGNSEDQYTKYITTGPSAGTSVEQNAWEFMVNTNAGQKRIASIYYYDEDDDGEPDLGDKVVGLSVSAFNFNVVNEPWEEGDTTIELKSGMDSSSTSDFQLPLDDEGDVDLSKIYSSKGEDVKELLLGLQEGDYLMITNNNFMGAQLYDDDDARVAISSGTHVETGAIVEIFDPTPGYHSGDYVVLDNGITLNNFYNKYSGPTKNGKADYTTVADSDLGKAMEDGTEVTFYCLGGNSWLSYEFVEEAGDYAILLDYKQESGEEGSLGYEQGQILLLTASGDQIAYDVEPDSNPEGDAPWFDEEDDAGMLVEYSLNSDGEVDEVDEVDADDDNFFNYDDNIMLLDSKDDKDYFLADNVIIFNISDGDENKEDWDVLDDSELGEADALVVLDDDGDAEVVVVYGNYDPATGDNDYALFTTTQDVMRDGDLVQKATAYVGGVMTTLYTDPEMDGDITVEYVSKLSGKTLVAATTNWFTFGEVEIDGDTINDATNVVPIFSTTEETLEVRANSVKIGDKARALADDIVIYEITADYEDGDLEYVLSVKIIDFDELHDDMIVGGYELNDDDEVKTLIVADSKDNDTEDWLGTWYNLD